jgi:hypothetical protein
MNEIKVNNEKVKVSIAKMLSDKNSIRSYMKGKISLSTLTKKGIKLAKPL